MDEEERKRLREIFKSSLIDVMNDYDPSGIITDTIKKDTGMGFTKYLDDKTEEFISKLKNKRLI